MSILLTVHNDVNNSRKLFVIQFSTILTFEGSAFAITTNTFAISELDIHIFVPFITYLSPTNLAVVLRENASEPELGSDKQKLPA